VASDQDFNFDALLRPIPGADPAGVELPYEIVQELKLLRREPIPGDPTTESWKPDWRKVIKITKEFLTETGKDIKAAVILVEAATKAHGAAGLRDGLTLLHRLVAECWDRLHPRLEGEDGPEVREAPIRGLNEAGKGVQFPQTIASMPLFSAQREAFCAYDLRNKDRKPALDEAIAAATPEDLEKLRPVHADLLAARKALGDLAAALTARRSSEDSATNYTSPETPGNLGTAIGQCIAFVEKIAEARQFALVPGAAPAADAATTDAPGPGGPTAAPAGNRDGLYRQIEQIAAALRRVEPHSPVPFLLERCVKLGRLPFPELMRAMLGQNSAVGELDTLLGIERPS
jgi:type VI secretion system protein ImpA